MSRGRGNGSSQPGTKHSLNPRYAFGTVEEIAQRDKGTFQPDPPAFAQLTGGPGGNLNDLPTDRITGGSDLKFSRGT